MFSFRFLFGSTHLLSDYSSGKESEHKLLYIGQAYRAMEIGAIANQHLAQK